MSHFVKRYRRKNGSRQHDLWLGAMGLYESRKLMFFRFWSEVDSTKIRNFNLYETFDEIKK